MLINLALDIKRLNLVRKLRKQLGHIFASISSQAGLRADGAGESALPAEESPSAGTGRAQTLRNLQENIIDFIMGAGGETSLYLPCFLILAPHLSCHLAFPLLCVGAAGDEGDPV